MLFFKKTILAAIQRAPCEPLYGSPLLLVTKQLLAMVENQRLKDENWDGYVRLQESLKNELSMEQKNFLDLYLGITAFEMAHHLREFSSVSSDLALGYKWANAMRAINILAKNLMSNTEEELIVIEEKTLQQMRGASINPEKKLVDFALSVQKEKRENEGLKDDLDTEKKIIAKIIENAKKRLQSGTGGSVIRYIMSVYNEVNDVCRSQGVLPRIKNLTLGDVTGKNMPEEIVERMGYDPMGSKGLAIASRAKAYESMLYEAGVQFDPHRYDLQALGWSGLRQRFIEYGMQFGLYPDKKVEESMVGEGGAGTLLRVFTAAHMFLQKKAPGKTFSVYFPNPAFRMVGDAAADAGLKVVEKATKPSNGFFPDPKEVDLYLTKHEECKIFIFIPIGNPNANFPEVERVTELLRILEKHDTILVNDFAYLGTGEEQKNTQLAKALSTYKKRIDSFSMSKIFGRTGLRCGCAITTDKEIAKEFSPAATHIQLGLSYPMQQEAMALWDFVPQSDRNVLNRYYKTQQNNLLKALKNNDLTRIKNKKAPLIDSKKPIFYLAGLYLYVPLSQGTDTFDVLQETGYGGVPDSAFSHSALVVEGPYVRFALGVERI